MRAYCIFFNLGMVSHLEPQGKGRVQIFSLKRTGLSLEQTTTSCLRVNLLGVQDLICNNGATAL